MVCAPPHGGTEKGGKNCAVGRNGLVQHTMSTILTKYVVFALSIPTLTRDASTLVRLDVDNGHTTDILSTRGNTRRVGVGGRIVGPTSCSGVIVGGGCAFHCSPIRGMLASADAVPVGTVAVGIPSSISIILSNGRRVTIGGLAVGNTRSIVVSDSGSPTVNDGTGVAYANGIAVSTPKTGFTVNTAGDDASSNLLAVDNTDRIRVGTPGDDHVLNNFCDGTSVAYSNPMAVHNGMSNNDALTGDFACGHASKTNCICFADRSRRRKTVSTDIAPLIRSKGCACLHVRRGRSTRLGIRGKAIAMNSAADGRLSDFGNRGIAMTSAVRRARSQGFSN